MFCYRWGDTKVSMAWAGSHIKAVDIDSYGQFPFILAKLVDNTKAHRLLVRGHHNSSPKELLKTLNAEVSPMPNLSPRFTKWGRAVHRIAEQSGTVAILTEFGPAESCTCLIY